MKIKFMILIVILLYIFIFPSKAKAEEITVYYLKDDNVYGDILKQSFQIPNNENLAKKIFITLDKLFNHIQNINYIPQNTKVLNVERIEEKVYINLSGEILSYGGGSNYEIGLIRQLLLNIFQYDEIGVVSITVNDEKRYFPEGSLVYGYERKGRENE